MGYPKVEVNVLEFASPSAKKAQQFNVSNMCAADTVMFGRRPKLSPQSRRCVFDAVGIIIRYVSIRKY